VKGLLDWVLAQRTRLIIVAIVAAPLLPVIAAALIAVETARRGATRGSLAGAGVLAGLVVLAVLSRTDKLLFASIGMICALSGIAMGGLIRRAGNLVLAFQAAVLICFAVVLLISVLGIDARLLLEPAIQQLVAMLPEGTPPADVEFVRERSPAVLLATIVFSQAIGALLLGFWWVSLAAGQRRFGQEFRQIRLGRLVGAVATALLALGLVFEAPVVQNLTPLALLGFLLQGIAVLHAWAHLKKWRPAAMAPLYLVLLTPLNVLVVLPISMLGLVDCWFDLRALLLRKHESTEKWK